MEKRTLYLVIAIVLVVAVVFSISNFTGQPIALGDKGDCIDSDGGEDPYTPGIAGYENRDYEYKDECYSESGSGGENWLKENLCLEKVSAERYYCENGCLKDKNGVGYCAEGPARKLAY